VLLFLARSWYLLICTILLNKHSTAQTQTRLRRSSVSLPGQGIVHRKGNLLKGRRGQSRTSPTDPLYTYDTSLSLIFVYLFGPQLCGAPVAHYYFYIFRTMTRVCVVCFINSILGNRYGLGVIPQIRGPGVAGSSPSTLTTSLTTPVPSSSSSNGPTTTPLTTRGFYPGGSVVWAGPKFVRPHW